jgi:CBS domain-containing protein
MQAKDVMTTPAITATPDTRVEQVAELLLEHRISAVPVVDADGRLEGIVSEGDLMRRAESGTERKGSWWLALVALKDELPRAYMSAHGRRAAEVMTRDVVTVEETAPLEHIAGLLEKHRIKRVPVVREGKVRGIVSRANLLHGLAGRPPAPPALIGDTQLRERVLAELGKAGIESVFVNVVVHGGVVRLWGTVSGEAARQAAGLAARNAAGGNPVEDHLAVRGMAQTLMWE